MPESLREIPFAIDDNAGDRIDGDVRFVDTGALQPVVVFVHGFKGFKDWGPFPAWGRALARSGFVAVHLNVSHNGVSAEAPTAFTELDRFARNTYTRELNDVRAVVDAVADHDLPDAPIDTSRIGLMGHSRGGGTAILQAARDDRVRALVTWSAVSTFIGRFTDEQIRDWETTGTTDVVNSRTGQTMPLDRVVYDDAMAHADELDIEAAAAQIDVPWLIVHAEDDEAVDIDAAETLAAANDRATLLRATGGHTFGGAHPHDGTVPDSLQQVWDATIAFFDRAHATSYDSGA